MTHQQQYDLALRALLICVALLAAIPVLVLL